MKTSQFFLRTYKEIPQEAKNVSHRLLVKGGYVFQTASGSFSLLPLGFLIFEKIKKVIRGELNRTGCQEILMPIVHPARLWKESGRYFNVGRELLKAKGRDEEYVLAMTHEETVTDIIRKTIHSYEDLPFILNQIQTKFRDEPRPRGGLLRLKEFVMQDAYSFDKDEDGLDKSYKKIIKAYENIFKRVGLNAMKVAASSGIMGGGLSEEFMILSSAGEDEVVICPKCGYKANIESASATPSLPLKKLKAEKIEEVETPKMTSAQEVADYLKAPLTSVIKSMVFKRDKGLVLVLLRGDLEVDEAKLQSSLGEEVHRANEEDFKKSGLILGFVGPMGLKNMPVYADYSLKLGGPYVTGANKIDTHLIGVKTKDFKIEKWVDAVKVKEGDACTECSFKLEIKKAIELGHTFKLGTKYSKSMGAYFMDGNGKKKPILMGCYGIGLERLMAAVVETNYDDKGIIWPKSIAPFSVYLMDITTTKKDKKIAEGLYNNFIASGVDVLYDDRDKTAGYKFAEADLIGCPLRLTISSRSLSKGCVEVKERGKKEAELIKIAETVERIKKLI